MEFSVWGQALKSAIYSVIPRSTPRVFPMAVWLIHNGKFSFHRFILWFLFRTSLNKTFKGKATLLTAHHIPYLSPTPPHSLSAITISTNYTNYWVFSADCLIFPLSLHILVNLQDHWYFVIIYNFTHAAKCMSKMENTRLHSMFGPSHTHPESRPPVSKKKYVCLFLNTALK